MIDETLIKKNDLVLFFVKTFSRKIKIPFFRENIFTKNTIHLLLELTLRYWLSLNHRMRNGSDGSW